MFKLAAIYEKGLSSSKINVIVSFTAVGESKLKMYMTVSFLNISNILLNKLLVIPFN